MKPRKILYLSFYFRPDLCAGSFRNSPLFDELAKQSLDKNISIDLFTTPPQRYSTFKESYLKVEEYENVRIERIEIPEHQSGITDQIKSFVKYYKEVKRRIRNKDYDLVFASSSRLFTAFLGYKVAKSRKLPLYLDIRDIFTDTIGDVFKSAILKSFALPVLKRIEAKTFNYAVHINLISAGFKSYFKKYTKPEYSYFSNGIDKVFIEAAMNNSNNTAIIPNLKKIVYAGNIGEGQGLHKIIPPVANILGDTYQFIIFGDGGAKKMLLEEINQLGLKNVFVKNPIKRDDLIKEYLQADYLFIHLNDYQAFEKVLPSKVFELGVFDKVIIAGVSGYAAEFLNKNLPSSIVFPPGDFKSMAELLKVADIKAPIEERKLFVENYNRAKINYDLSESILKYVK